MNSQIFTSLSVRNMNGLSAREVLLVPLFPTIFFRGDVMWKLTYPVSGEGTQPTVPHFVSICYTGRELMRVQLWIPVTFEK